MRLPDALRRLAARVARRRVRDPDQPNARYERRNPDATPARTGSDGGYQPYTPGHSTGSIDPGAGGSGGAF